MKGSSEEEELLIEKTPRIQRIMNRPNIFFSKSKISLKIVISILLLTFFCFTFFLKNNTQNSKHQRLNCISTEEDPEKLEEALKHIMIRCYGIYTLIGSKPITQFSVLDPGILDFSKMSDDQIREIYDQCSDKVKELTTFEEFKEPVSLQYDQEELWNFWYKRWKNYTGEKYLFYEIDDYIELNGEKKRSLEGVFVNVLETAYLLKKYYEDFKKVVGRDFDPLEVVYELPNRNESEFWRKIKGDFFSGLLFGFGEKNAYLFQLRSQKRIPFHGNLLFLDVEEVRKKDKSINKKELTINDLCIPDYVSFSPTDPIRLRYKQERDEILKIYSKKNFLKKTLRYLDSESFLPEVINISDIEK